MIRQLPTYWFNILCDTQRAVQSVDTGGGPVSTWATNLSSVPMRANFPSGNQEAHGGRISATLDAKFYVNGNPAPDILPTDRIVFGTRVFDIKAVKDVDQAGVFLTIDTVEVQPSTAVL